MKYNALEVIEQLDQPGTIEQRQEMRDRHRVETNRTSRKHKHQNGYKRYKKYNELEQIGQSRQLEK